MKGLSAGEILLTSMTEDPVDISKCQASKLSNIIVPKFIEWYLGHCSQISAISDFPFF